jgi:pyrroline-5-carboxylate reductase
LHRHAARIAALKGDSCPEIVVYDIEQAQARGLADTHPNFRAATSPSDALEGASLILLAVKPQNMESVAKAIRDAGKAVSRDAVLLSVLAGTRTAGLTRQTRLKKVVRCMPNTPCALGQGVTVWLSTPSVTEEEREGVRVIFACMGEAVEVKDESFLDMATALTGSGPAFVYLAMEAMVDAGVQMGFPRSTAVKLVQNTFQVRRTHLTLFFFAHTSRWHAHTCTLMRALLHL